MHFPPSLPFLSIGPVILLRIGCPSATLATGTLSVQTYDKGVLKLKLISLLSLLHDSWLVKDLACFRPKKVPSHATYSLSQIRINTRGAENGTTVVH